MKRLVYLLLLLALPAWADLPPGTSRDVGNGCRKVTLCDQSSGTGACTRLGDQIVQRLAGFYSITVYTTASTAASWDVDVLTNDEGYDAASAGAGTGTTLNSTAITNTNMTWSANGLFDYVWVDIQTHGGSGSVVATMLYCPLSR